MVSERFHTAGAEGIVFQRVKYSDLPNNAAPEGRKLTAFRPPTILGLQKAGERVGLVQDWCIREGIQTRNDFHGRRSACIRRRNDVKFVLINGHITRALGDAADVLMQPDVFFDLAARPAHGHLFILDARDEPAAIKLGEDIRYVRVVYLLRFVEVSDHLLSRKVFRVLEDTLQHAQPQRCGGNAPPVQHRL